MVPALILLYSGDSADLFVNIRGEQPLREVAAEALTLYGGMASFSDTGTAESSFAVDQSS